MPTSRAPTSRGANLKLANLREANLQGTNLRGTNLQGADLRGTNLERVNMEGANLREANFQGTNLQGTNLRVADLRGTNLKGVDLEGADLQMADLQGADLQGADLQGANLQEANLQEANLQEANLQEANLQKVGLRGAKLWRTNLHEANLQEANLQGAKLTGTNLRGTRLINADLQAAILKDAILDHADLEGANLIGANIRGCRAQDTNLRRTRLLIKQMETIENTWIGQPLSLNLVLFGQDESGDNIPAHRLLMLFPGHQALAKALADIEKHTSAYQQNFDIKMVTVDGHNVYLARVKDDDPTQLIRLGYELVNPLAKITPMIHNLSALLIENIVSTKANMATLQQFEKHLGSVMGELIDLLNNFNIEKLDRLEKLATQAQTENTSLDQDQILEICNLFYRSLEKQPDQPGLRARLLGFIGKISEGVTEHAVAMPLVYGAKEVMGLDGLALVGGVGLAAGLGITVKKWLNSRKPKAIEHNDKKKLEEQGDHSMSPVDD